MNFASTLPLQGIRVLELGHIVAGPVGAMILAELGADVIKVERPGAGDQARYSRGNQGYFLAFNSCKRSVTIDLKSEGGKAAFLKLVKTADGYRETLPDPTGPSLAQVMAEYLLDVRLAQNQVILKTSTGSANSLAVALDQENWAEIAGTIAGDDTVLVVCWDNQRAKTIEERLLGYLNV